MVTAGATNISATNPVCQAPTEAADLLTLTEAARLLSQASGARITYRDLYNRFLNRVNGPRIKLISCHRGRTLRGRPVPTKCIKRSDLWALAAYLGYELSVVTSSSTAAGEPPALPGARNA